MGLGHLSIQDCNDEMEMMIRSTKGAVGWSQRYFHLDVETDKLVVELLYNKSIDCLLLFYDDGEYITLFKDYIPSEDSGYLTKRDGTKWKTGAYTIILFKAVPLEDMKIDGRMIADKTLKYSSINNLFIHDMIKDIEDNYIIDGKIIKNGTISYKKIDKNYMTQMIEDLENNYVLDGKVIRHGTISLDQVSNEFLTTINTKIKNASLTEKGVVQLSNSINSNSEVLAATPKAVKTTYDMAIKGSFFGVATNSSTIQFNANIPGLTYYDGLEFRIVFKTAPTTNAKLNINGLGNYNLKIGPDNISDGDIEINIPYTFLKYGNNFFCKASSRGKEYDVPEIADPDNAHLYASIPSSTNFNLLKVKNSDEIYTLINNNLYLLNCKKKKFIPLNEKRQFIDNNPVFNTLSKFKNMYIYGNRLFNSKFNLIKDFYCTTNQQIITKKSDGSDKNTIIYLHGYLVPDYINNKLYVVKTKINTSPDSIQCYYYQSGEHHSKDGDYVAGYEDYSVLLDLEIYSVDENYNLNLIKEIKTNELIFPLCTGDSGIYPHVYYISYPDIIISGGQYGVSNGSSISYSNTAICNMPTIKFTHYKASINVISDKPKKIEFKSGRGCLAGAIRYKFNNNELEPIKLIAQGKYDHEQADGMGNPYAESYSDYAENFTIHNKKNKYIKFEYYFHRSGYHKSKGYRNNEMIQTDLMYDADLDEFVWVGSAYGSGSKKHSASENCRTNIIIDDLNIQRITNNIDKYLGNKYLHGEENGKYVYNENNLSQYLGITSKYGIKTRRNIIGYKDGINQFYYDMQYSEYNRKRDNTYLYNYARTDALFTLMIKSINRNNTTITRKVGGWYTNIIINRKLGDYTFQHSYSANTNTNFTDEEIYNQKDLTGTVTGLNFIIGTNKILTFSLNDDTSTLPSTDINKYNIYPIVIDIYKF